MAVSAGGVRILGLVGYPGSGRRTLATMLTDHNFADVSFAAPLRSFIWAVNPLILDDRIAGGIEDYRSLVDEHGYDGARQAFPEVKRLQDVLGKVGIAEHLGEGAWIDAWEQAALATLGDGKRVVVPDVTLTAEVERIHELGGVVARVVRPGSGPDGAESLADRYPGAFPIYNDGERRALREKAEEVSNLLGSLNPTTAHVMLDGI